MDSKSRRSQSVMLLLLLALFATAGANNPAEARSMCYEAETYGGLFCNDGSMMTVCEGETCTVNCGRDDVEVTCLNPE